MILLADSVNIEGLLLLVLVLLVNYRNHLNVAVEGQLLSLVKLRSIIDMAFSIRHVKG